MKFSQEDKDFLDALNTAERPESRIYLTAQHGYMRNLDRGQLQHLENIYKRYINKDYVLCFHCPYDVMKLVLDIYRALEAERAQEAFTAAVEASAEPVEEPAAEKPKRSKGKKAEPEKIIGEGDE